MCEGFGGIVTQDGRILFCEPDGDGDCSHSELLSRIGMQDNRDKFIRPFVRFEFPDWTLDSFRWDECDTLPGWVADEHERGCKRLLERAAAAWDEYEKVRAAAWDAFVKTLSTITGYVP